MVIMQYKAVIICIQKNNWHICTQPATQLLAANIKYGKLIDLTIISWDPP